MNLTWYIVGQLLVVAGVWLLSEAFSWRVCVGFWLLAEGIITVVHALVGADRAAEPWHGGALPTDEP